MHWHLDITFGEDSNTTLNKSAAINLNVIRKFTFGILEAFDVGKKVSPRKKRRRIGVA